MRDPAAWAWRAGFKVAGGLLGAARRTAPPTLIHELSFVGQPVEESLIHLLDVLHRLPDRQRACIVLRHVGRLRATEIAEVLGIEPGAVRVNLHRAHTRLRSLLEES